MQSEQQRAALGDALFSQEDLNIFAVLDGASIPDLLTKLFEQEPDYVCLQRGELEPDMAEVAPYLVALAPDAEFTTWLLEEGWCRHWGVFLSSQDDLRAVCSHLRALLIVYDAEGRPLQFRFYDPRVLRTFLPTCRAAELARFFGPVESFLLEAEDAATALRFRSRPDGLQCESLPLA